MTDFPQESGDNIPLFNETKNQSKCVFHDDILQSKYKLVLIKYTPQRTLQERGYLVQVDQI